MLNLRWWIYRHLFGASPLWIQKSLISCWAVARWVLAEDRDLFFIENMNSEYAGNATYSLLKCNPGYNQHKELETASPKQNAMSQFTRCIMYCVTQYDHALSISKSITSSIAFPAHLMQTYSRSCFVDVLFIYLQYNCCLNSVFHCARTSSQCISWEYPHVCFCSNVKVSCMHNVRS